MIKKNLLKLIVSLFILSVFPSANLFSQTAGTFTLNVVTTPPSGSYGSSNLLVIWVENANNTFIKTLWGYDINNGNQDHLANWMASSNGDIVGADANSGATLTGGKTLSILWNGTNVAGTLVADGSYNLKLEMAWNRTKVEGTDKITAIYPFTKGTTHFLSTPANTSFFSNISLDWNPIVTGSEKVLATKDFNIYPNPSNGILKIDFRKNQHNAIMQIYDQTGKIVYNEKVNDISEGVRTFNLMNLKPGNYYGSLHFPERDVVFNVVIVK